MQYSEIVHEATRSRFTDTTAFDIDGVNAALEAIAGDLERFEAALAGASRARVSTAFFVEARYRAQVWELDTALPASRIEGNADLAALAEAFHRAHERVYAVRDEGSPVEFVNWKGRITISLFDPPPPPEQAVVPHRAESTSWRECYFAETGRAEAPVYRGDRLAFGAEIEGPAIIEEPTTTIVVYPGLSARLSGAGNYILTCA